jgi:HK97 family phage prohead protease
MEAKFRPKDYIRTLDEKAERRFISEPLMFGEVESNGAKAIDENIIEGYAAVFNRNSEDFGGWIEQIAPGAFSERLKDDAVALFNHSMNHVLGRNGINLRLSEDKTGLRYSVTLPDTSLARDVKALVKAGIICKSSFAFTVKEERFIKADDKAGTPAMRIIDKVERLYDVSPVTVPAYPDSTVAARSFEKSHAKEEIQKSLEQIKYEFIYLERKLKSTINKTKKRV